MINGDTTTQAKPDIKYVTSVAQATEKGMTAKFKMLFLFQKKNIQDLIQRYDKHFCRSKDNRRNFVRKNGNICYDNTGNFPYKGKNFNTKNIWENVGFCYLYD